METFAEGDFHWNPKRFIYNKGMSLGEAIEFLNAMTEDQKVATRIYGRSCYEEGYDQGSDPA